jgi:hypothetical protein
MVAVGFAGDWHGNLHCVPRGDLTYELEGRWKGVDTTRLDPGGEWPANGGHVDADIGPVDQDRR